ncbi:MAG: hypothetical protein ACFB50_00240 [Rubrobacteraceae bacterium]
MDQLDNPYTFLESYKVHDVHGNEIGKVEDTVYDAPADVLKYIIADGRPIPADRMEVHADDQSVSVPYDAETVESAPKLRHFSGEFDEALHQHYRDPG